MLAGVFRYLGLLAYGNGGRNESEPIKRWIWEESKQVMETSFRFLERVDPVDYVEGIAGGGMLQYAPQHILCGDDFADRY